jgi:hypothetical protein
MAGKPYLATGRPAANTCYSLRAESTALLARLNDVRTLPARRRTRAAIWTIRTYAGMLTAAMQRPSVRGVPPSPRPGVRFLRPGDILLTFLVRIQRELPRASRFTVDVRTLELVPDARDDDWALAYFFLRDIQRAPERLKRCQQIRRDTQDRCLRFFWDQSKNKSRNYCGGEGCNKDRVRERVRKQRRALGRGTSPRGTSPKVALAAR